MCRQCSSLYGRVESLLAWSPMTNVEGRAVGPVAVSSDDVAVPLRRLLGRMPGLRRPRSASVEDRPAATDVLSRLRRHWPVLVLSLVAAGLAVLDHVWLFP